MRHKDYNISIGILGFGNMGSAISAQLRSKYEVWVFDKDRNKTLNSQVNVADSIGSLLGKTQVLILAVKPQDFDSVLREFKGCIKDTLIVSIAAGISTAYIEKILGKVRVIRAMPNIGVKIGASVTCLSKGTFASDSDLDIVQELFYYLGTMRVIDESMINAATAISGSGPAYIFDFMEKNNLKPVDMPEHTRHDLMKRLERAAESVGFCREEAAFLAVNTTSASLLLVTSTRLSPAELKKQVTSKGGTTEAGLAALEMTGSWEDAAKAALKRAEELSK